MKRTDLLNVIADLFAFKIVKDSEGNEYVLYASNPIDSLDCIEDKTQFEALQNHEHLVENVRLSEFEELKPVAIKLGEALAYQLKCRYPGKRFVVYVTLQAYGDMIIRFHQRWEGEPAYYDPENFRSSWQRVCQFEV